jgi:hypothetical protein
VKVKKVRGLFPLTSILSRGGRGRSRFATFAKEDASLQHYKATGYRVPNREHGGNPDNAMDAGSGPA